MSIGSVVASLLPDYSGNHSPTCKLLSMSLLRSWTEQHFRSKRHALLRYRYCHNDGCSNSAAATPRWYSIQCMKTRHRAAAKMHVTIIQQVPASIMMQMCICVCALCRLHKKCKQRVRCLLRLCDCIHTSVHSVGLFLTVRPVYEASTQTDREMTVNGSNLKRATVKRIPANRSGDIHANLNQKKQDPIPCVKFLSLSAL
jgi:hypothetical protein